MTNMSKQRVKNMSEQKDFNAPAATDGNIQVASSDEASASRREFLQKYGKYAAVTPVVLSMMMHSGRAPAATSDGGP